MSCYNRFRTISLSVLFFLHAIKAETIWTPLLASSLADFKRLSNNFTWHATNSNPRAVSPKWCNFSLYSISLQVKDFTPEKINKVQALSIYQSIRGYNLFFHDYQLYGLLSLCIIFTHAALITLH